MKNNNQLMKRQMEHHAGYDLVYPLKGEPISVLPSRTKRNRALNPAPSKTIDDPTKERSTQHPNN